MTKDYKLNDCGVVLNPEELTYKSDNGASLMVKVANLDGGWAYGYSWSVNTCGGGMGVTLDSETYETREKAIIACCVYLKHHHGKELDTLLNQAEADCRQLTLF